MKKIKRFKRALQGMQGITVWVHEFDAIVAADGLSRQHLQDKTIIRILDSGIKALSIGNVPEPPGNPWLNIFLNLVKHEEVYFYIITVRMDEIVRPERNKAVKTIGATWETSQVGIAQQTEMAVTVEKSLDHLIDYFIYDYLFENEKYG